MNYGWPPDCSQQEGENVHNKEKLAVEMEAWEPESFTSKIKNHLNAGTGTAGTIPMMIRTSG
jgi:hypothetical protein